MIRANIYSIEALTERHKATIEGGLDRVAQYMGMTVAFHMLRVRLPLTDTGKVRPQTVGLRKLDTSVNLHVFAVPLDRGPDDNMMGFSFRSSGVSFVDIYQDPKKAEITASHEAAHSLGFLLPRSPQGMQNSPGHCSDGGCLMHSQHSDQDSSPLATIQRMQKATRQAPTGSFTREASGLPQDDFCNPCQRDLAAYGEAMLNLIAEVRSNTGQIRPVLTPGLNPLQG